MNLFLGKFWMILYNNAFRVNILLKDIWTGPKVF